MTKKLLGFIRTETAQAIGFALIAALIFWAVGCESEVRSLTDPVRLVTRDQLTAEVKAFAIMAEERYKALDKEDHFRRVIFEKLALFAQTGALNPAGVVSAVLTILGVAAVADNVKKRVEIKTIKKNNGGSK